MAKQVSGSLRMGPSTHEVPLQLFNENRTRLCGALQASSSAPPHSVVLLQGGETISFYDTDTDYVFRQESYFMWAFGVLEPGCFGAIDVTSGAVTLFVPRLPDEYAVWMGPLLSTDDFKEKYQVDHVYYVDEMKDVLKKNTSAVLLLMKGENTDSKLPVKPAYFKGIEDFKLNTEILFPTIAELRVIKTPLELSVMRYVARVSSDAHKLVMRAVRTDGSYSEYQAEAVFLAHCYSVGGCRHVSYTCICGSGCNSAILHYGHAAQPNRRTIKDGDMCLFDMGANYHGYDLHKLVMRAVRTDGSYSEYQAEAVFLAHCYSVGGCRHVSYTCICGSGCNSAILHYGHAAQPNRRTIKDGDMCLFDMGANYHGYASDITCSFPANGKFTPLQRLIYTSVLASSRAVLSALRPGARWPDMHLLSARVLLEHLAAGGLLQGPVDDMMQHHLYATFQPHGLGHLLGLDVHDVAGYTGATPHRPTAPGLNKLRTARVMEEGMVLTVEPGCYFIKPRLIYNAVLAASRAVLSALRPGARWPDMHLLSARVLLEHLAAGGLLQGPVDDMMQHHLYATFQPHGLGHLLGLDVHDVAGYTGATPLRPTAPGLNKLRTARVMQEGMVVTVEPGCYFIKPLLDAAKSDPKLSRFLVLEELEKYEGFGGVRIEDDVIITKDGVENITFVPRTIEEIEAWMAGKDY